MSEVCIFGCIFTSQPASIPDAPADEAAEVSSVIRPRKRRAQRHSWVYPGWTYVERTRKSGKQAGYKYREYFDPSSKMYRSKDAALKAA